MVPSGPITSGVIDDLAGVLEKGDLVIDGGNSRFTVDKPHASLLGKKGIHFVDCGVSGGVWGLKNGYGLMAGGDDSDIELAMPVFDALRPDGPRDEGFVHVGPVGSGHYAKMVHNGIEYAQMQALAEGYELLDANKGPPRCHRRLQGLGTRHRRPQLASRAAGPRTRGGSGAEGDRGVRRGFRRRPVDHPGGPRARGPGSDDQRIDLRAIRLASDGLAGDEGGRRPPEPVRRARGAGLDRVVSRQGVDRQSVGT